MNVILNNIIPELDFWFEKLNLHVREIFSCLERKSLPHRRFFTFSWAALNRSVISLRSLIERNACFDVGQITSIPTIALNKMKLSSVPAKTRFSKGQFWTKTCALEECTSFAGWEARGQRTGWILHQRWDCICDKRN
jgi:hypothetical protein